MLRPESRHLLTDALRPPDGYAVEVALATTYTLSLQSVLLAPLAMAAYDQTRAVETDGSTPLALLESVRRHAEHTTVLCQAGGIHVPGDHPRLAAFAEGCVAEVEPPPGRTFHPKIWLLRFLARDGTRLHRFACLSRNLTGDTSWDTLLVCDEEPDGALDPAPVATFVTELLNTTVRRLDPRREEQLRDVCTGLRSVRLGVPAPFTAGRVVALGTPSGEQWPLPRLADRWAVVSPFLDASSVARLPASPGPRWLLSRPDTFDRLGTRACGPAGLRVLQADADAPVDPTDTVPTETDPTHAGGTSSDHRNRGLHAKLFLWEQGRRAHLLTGSANCTSAAFGGNVELSVLLSGPVADCGVTALLGDDDGGFLRLTQPYRPAQDDPAPDLRYRAERALEGWHAALAVAGLQLRVSDQDASYDVALALALPDDPEGLADRTTVSLVGAGAPAWRPLRDAPPWRGVGLAGLTPYLAVRTSLDVDGESVVRECVLVCEVVGAPDDRHAQLLRGLLADPRTLLRYLALLLGDPSVDDLVDQLAHDDAPDDPERGGAWRPGGFDDLVLVEPLVRAAARGDDSLGRVQRLFDDLRDDDSELPQVDADFLQLWHAVWEARA